MAFDKQEIKQLKDLFVEQDKRTDKKIDNLAIMVKRGFDDITDKMATKEDLKKMATKEDLKKMATKEDLKRLEKKVDDGFIHMNASFDFLRREVENIREKLEKAITREQYFEIDERLTIVEEKLGIKY